MPRDTTSRLNRPDSQTVRVFRQLLRTFGMVERIMQPYFARFGITGSQWGVLRNLLRAHDEGLSGLRISDLSEKLLIQPPSVTGVVDRLERAGLVERKQDPDDLRATLVGLTRSGCQLVKNVLVGHERKIES